MKRTSRSLWLIALLTVLPAATARGDEADEALKAARSLLLRGRYEESAEAYAALLEKHPVQAALGISRCRAETGDSDEAQKTLQNALEKHPAAAELHAELAVLEFERGDHAAARKSVDAALKNHADELAARWIDAELQRAAGNMKEADAAYKWLVDHYNNRDV